MNEDYRKFKDLDELCCACENKLTENTKPIQEWKEYESKLYCPNCKKWMTGSIVKW